MNTTNTIDDINSLADRMRIDGHILSIQDIELAEKSFLTNMSRAKIPELLLEIKTKDVQEYTEYLKKFIKKQNKMMIDSIVEEQ